MSQLQDEKSYVPLADGKWGKVVVNADGTAISAGGGGGAGDASAANQDEQTTLLQTIDVNANTIATDTGNISANTPDLGQAAMAASSPVVLASNQSAIPVTAAGTAASNAAASGNPVMVGAKYNSSNQTFDDGDVSNLQSDVNGFLRSREQYQPGYEDNTANVAKVEQRFSYLNIVAGQATTVVKASAGFLHSIIFNSPATATNTTNVYDHASGAGTIIATPLATAVVSPTTVMFNCSFSTGLTIITAAANGSNMTVVFR